MKKFKQKKLIFLDLEEELNIQDDIKRQQEEAQARLLEYKSIIERRQYENLVR